MIHHIFANRSNIGDWLSAQAIQRLLLPNTVNELFCGEMTFEATLAHLHQLTPKDLIIVGGGGLFMDYFVPFWDGFRDIARSIPFVIWGVGYCDMKRCDSRPPNTLLQEVVKSSRLCVVRDALTWHYLSLANLPQPVACPTLSIISEAQLGWGVLHVDAYDNVGESNYTKMETFAKKFADETKRPFYTFNNEIREGSLAELASAISRYKDVDIIITGRLHACIIGIALGRKVIAVSGDRKIESFMHAAGLGDWVVDLPDIGTLLSKVRCLSEQITPVGFIEKTRRQHLQIASEIKKIISDVEQL